MNEHRPPSACASVAPARPLETLGGPLGSFRNFLAMVALPNCIDYFDAEKRETGDTTRREETRHLFNAVVALDSVVDYMFHEQGAPGRLADFIATLNAPEVAALREIANALKHCVRGQHRGRAFQETSDKTHARDIHVSTLHVDVVAEANALPSVNFEITSALLSDARDALANAFRYWHQYMQ